MKYLSYCLNVGKLFNVPVRIHWSILLTMLLVGYNAYTTEPSFTSVMFSTLLMSTLYISVLAHEFGHVLVARRYGVVTHDVILNALGGAARISGIPRDGRQEALVGIAGPAVSFIIGVVAILVSLLLGALPGSFFLFAVGFVNLFVGVFNLIPALPSDGGRIIRGLLSHKIGMRKATYYATMLSYCTCASLLAAGVVFADVMLIIIGLFLGSQAYAEYNAVNDMLDEEEGL